MMRHSSRVLAPPIMLAHRPRAAIIARQGDAPPVLVFLLVCDQYPRRKVFDLGAVRYIDGDVSATPIFRTQRTVLDLVASFGQLAQRFTMRPPIVADIFQWSTVR